VYLEADSWELVESNAWNSVRGVIEQVDEEAKVVFVRRDGGETSRLRLSELSFVARQDGTPLAMEDLHSGQTVVAEGVPEGEGGLTVEAIFVGR
jgi:hypothetical protein